MSHLNESSPEGEEGILHLVEASEQEGLSRPADCTLGEKGCLRGKAEASSTSEASDYEKTLLAVRTICPRER